MRRFDTFDPIVPGDTNDNGKVWEEAPDPGGEVASVLQLFQADAASHESIWGMNHIWM